MKLNESSEIIIIKAEINRITQTDLTYFFCIPFSLSLTLAAMPI